MSKMPQTYVLLGAVRVKEAVHSELQVYLVYCGIVRAGLGLLRKFLDSATVLFPLGARTRVDYVLAYIFWPCANIHTYVLRNRRLGLVRHRRSDNLQRR
jgi:hypothetical protein